MNKPESWFLRCIPLKVGLLQIQQYPHQRVNALGMSFRAACQITTKRREEVLLKRQHQNLPAEGSLGRGLRLEPFGPFRAASPTNGDGWTTPHANCKEWVLAMVQVYPASFSVLGGVWVKESVANGLNQHEEQTETRAPNLTLMMDHQKSKDYSQQQNNKCGHRKIHCHHQFFSTA